MPGRIVYVSFPAPRPVGGILVLSDHVAVLRSTGEDAVLWLPVNHAGVTLFHSDPAVTIEADQLDLAAEDLLVVPESAVVPDHDPAPGARKVIFSQNHFLSFHAWADRRELPYPGWEPEPATWVVSRESADVLGRLSQRPPAVIPNVIDGDLFRPGPHRRPTIAWMPRKRHLEAELIRRLLLVHPAARGVRLIEMDHMSRAEVAQTLAQTTVFIALGLSEGFGLPVAEALSAGCLVVGYDDGGGQEIFEAPGAFRVPEQRPALLVDTVLDLMQDPATPAAAAANRMWLHDRFNPARTTRALSDAVSTARMSPGDAATATHPWQWLNAIATGGIPASG